MLAPVLNPTPDLFIPTRIPGCLLWLDPDRGVTRAAGGASQFTRANSEYLSIADNASLSAGDIELEVGCWVYFDTLPAAGEFYDLVGKWNSGGTPDREYVLFCWNNAGTIRFGFSVRNPADSATTTVNANAFGTPSTATWYWVTAGHDPFANTIFIQVNTVTPINGTAHSAGVRDGAAAFVIGAEAGAVSFHNGRIMQAFVSKSLLTEAERTSIYNGGSGISFDDWPSRLLESGNLVSLWPLNESGGTRRDAHGSNDLTDNNTVTGVSGVSTITQCVSQIDDLSGNGNHVSQSTDTKRPIWLRSKVNGRPVLRFDGSNDLLARAATLDTGGDGTIVIVAATADPALAVQEIFGSGDEAVDTVYFTSRLNVGRAAVIQRNADPGNDQVRGGTTWVSKQFYLYVLQSDGTTYTIELDGTAETLTIVEGANTGDWLGDTSNRDNITIGAVKINAGETNFLQGDVALLLYYDRAISAAELGRIEAYVRRRYAINVSG